MGKSCEDRNFSEMRMAMPPHGGIVLESVSSEKVVFEKAGVAFIVQLGFTQENYVRFMFVQEQLQLVPVRSADNGVNVLLEYPNAHCWKLGYRPSH